MGCEFNFRGCCLLLNGAVTEDAFYDKGLPIAVQFDNGKPKCSAKICPYSKEYYENHKDNML